MLGLFSFSRITLLLVAMAAPFAPSLAHADESIAGQWRSKISASALIVMDVLADGRWTSQTVAGKKVIAEMAGTYVQTPSSPTAGKIVWTPVKSKTTEEHGPATVETDTYTLTGNANTLTLVNVGKKKNPMIFARQPFEQ